MVTTRADRKTKAMPRPDFRIDEIDHRQYDSFWEANDDILELLDKVMQGDEPEKSLSPAVVISRIAADRKASEATIREAIWYLLSLQKIAFTDDYHLALKSSPGD